MSFIKSIFSTKNNGNGHTQIKIAGIKINIKSSYQDKQYYRNLPIENNKIVFRHHIGSYGCNVKYIAEEILKQKLPYDLVFVVNKNILKFMKDYPENVRLVMTNTQEAYKEYATAKIWIDSERRGAFIKKGLFKRDGQKYIQTFHGSLGIKKTAPDREDVSQNAFRASIADALQIDYLISNSSYTSDFFRRIFWNNGIILETGHPRNDIFFKDTSAVKENVYNKLNINANKKLILYAPTLRENRDLSHYELDFNKLADAFSKKFGGEYAVALRLHPLILDLKNKYKLEFNDCINATDYSDIQELLCASDILITDYSSCIYDFMLQYKPGFIFATDRKEYEEGRGLYYPLTSTPFPVAENNEEMINNINDFDYEKYKIKVKEFLKEKGCIDDGNASKRVVEVIKSIIETPDELDKKIEEFAVK